MELSSKVFNLYNLRFKYPDGIKGNYYQHMGFFPLSGLYHNQEKNELAQEIRGNCCDYMD